MVYQKALQFLSDALPKRKGSWQETVPRAFAIVLFSFMTNQGNAQDRVPISIDWEAVTRAQQAFSNSAVVAAVRATVPIESELDNVQLPVLLLPRSSKRSSPRVRQQSSSYAAAYKLDGANLLVVGANSTLSVPPQLLESINFSPAAGAFDRTEDGADLSFTRFGASYTLRISCAKVPDSRCENADFLEKMAEDLIPAGGKGK